MSWLFCIGTIPCSMSTIVSLNTLQMDSNSLIGSIPSSFRLLTNLVSLILSSNKLSGIIIYW